MNPMSGTGVRKQGRFCKKLTRADPRSSIAQWSNKKKEKQEKKASKSLNPKKRG